MEMSNIYREAYNGLKDGTVNDKKTRKTQIFVIHWLNELLTEAFVEWKGKKE